MWRRNPHSHKAGDGYYQLPRSKQVIILHLRTGHNYMRNHLYTKFKIRIISLRLFGLADMTTEHILQDCPQHTDLRKKIWPTPVDLGRKLYGKTESVKRSASLVKESGTSVEVVNAEEKEEFKFQQFSYNHVNL
jgi:hypothetical protein